MTAEEAIAELKSIYDDLECQYESYTVNTFKTAISALEKQIPKKPMYADSLDKKYDTERCPTCGEIVRTSDYRSKYCPCCGQAIEWEESAE